MKFFLINSFLFHKKSYICTLGRTCVSLFPGRPARCGTRPNL